MQQILDQIDEIRQHALSELATVTSGAELQAWGIKYLGTRGEVRRLHDFIAKANGADKKSVGQRVNPVKKEVEAAFEEKKSGLSSDVSGSKDYIDVTEPGLRPQIGRTHVITQVTNELVELFGRMGFTVAAGPEVEDDFHNFIALNIPAIHPARDPLDNFYIAQDGLAASAGGENSALLMRTQTSTVQIRVME